MAFPDWNRSTVQPFHSAAIDHKKHTRSGVGDGGDDQREVGSKDFEVDGRERDNREASMGEVLLVDEIFVASQENVKGFSFRDTQQFTIL